MIFFTADLHFGHANIIDYCNRPFPNVEAMNRALIENWNSVVGEDDLVYVLGDVAMGKLADTIPLAGQLRGRKILIPGNHDACWKGRSSKNGGKVHAYQDAGFQIGPTHDRRPLTRGGREVELCHFPYTGDSHSIDRYDQWRPKDEGRWLLHGHVHDAWHIDRARRQFNVGVDVHDFHPVSADTVDLLIG